MIVLFLCLKSICYVCHRFHDGCLFFKAWMSIFFSDWAYFLSKISVPPYFCEIRVPF